MSTSIKSEREREREKDLKRLKKREKKRERKMVNFNKLVHTYSICILFPLLLFVCVYVYVSMRRNNKVFCLFFYSIVLLITIFYSDFQYSQAIFFMALMIPTLLLNYIYICSNFLTSDGKDIISNQLSLCI